MTESQAGQPARKLGGGYEIIGPPECPLLIRCTWFSCRWAKLLTHSFFPGATDKDPHDHPRSFVTICWRGGYNDIRRHGDADVVRAPAVRFRPAEHEHITHVHEDGARTVVVMGPLRRDWGFWRLGKWWPWRDYEHKFGLSFRCDNDSGAGVSVQDRTASAAVSVPVRNTRR